MLARALVSRCFWGMFLNDVLGLVPIVETAAGVVSGNRHVSWPVPAK